MLTEQDELPNDLNNLRYMDNYQEPPLATDFDTNQIQIALDKA